MRLVSKASTVQRRDRVLLRSITITASLLSVLLTAGCQHLTPVPRNDFSGEELEARQAQIEALVPIVAAIEAK